MAHHGQERWMLIKFLHDISGEDIWEDSYFKNHPMQCYEMNPGSFGRDLYT